MKFGFRELDSDTLDSPPEESTPRARRRRVYMHFMVSFLLARFRDFSFIRSIPVSYQHPIIR